jgi:capsular exopolysaccharide synthesis family protein
LYEALKEASRFRRATDHNGDNGLWGAWGIDGLDLPPLHSDPDALQPSAAPANRHWAAAVDIPDVADIPEAADIPDAAVDRPSALPGSPVQAKLDHTARLIPHAAHSAVVEHYRRLRAKILQQREAQPFRSLVVTSGAPQEGKTVTVLNLGLSFATLPSFKVLVIDGDMRRGTLGKWLGVANEQPGLSNLIDGSARLEDVVLKSDRIPMHFMVRGNSHVQELHISHLARHFQRLTEAFDLVLVDSPPVNLIADVQLLAASCDAVLVIARAFTTSRKSLEKAVQDLAPFRLIGAVLNAGVAHRSRRYYGYY